MNGDQILSILNIPFLSKKSSNIKNQTKANVTDNTTAITNQNNNSLNILNNDPKKSNFESDKRLKPLSPSDSETLKSQTKKSQLITEPEESQHSKQQTIVNLNTTSSIQPAANKHTSPPTGPDEKAIVFEVMRNYARRGSVRKPPPPGAVPSLSGFPSPPNSISSLNLPTSSNNLSPMLSTSQKTLEQSNKKEKPDAPVTTIHQSNMEKTQKKDTKTKDEVLDYSEDEDDFDLDPQKQKDDALLCISSYFSSENEPTPKKELVEKKQEEEEKPVFGLLAMALEKKRSSGKLLSNSNETNNQNKNNNEENNSGFGINNEIPEALPSKNQNMQNTDKKPIPEVPKPKTTETKSSSFISSIINPNSANNDSKGNSTSSSNDSKTNIGSTNNDSKSNIISSTNDPKANISSEKTKDSNNSTSNNIWNVFKKLVNFKSISPHSPSKVINAKNLSPINENVSKNFPNIENVSTTHQFQEEELKEGQFFMQNFDIQLEKTEEKSSKETTPEKDLSTKGNANKKENLDDPKKLGDFLNDFNNLPINSSNSNQKYVLLLLYLLNNVLITKSPTDDSPTPQNNLIFEITKALVDNKILSEKFLTFFSDNDFVSKILKAVEKDNLTASAGPKSPNSHVLEDEIRKLLEKNLISSQNVPVLQTQQQKSPGKQEKQEEITETSSLNLKIQIPLKKLPKAEIIEISRHEPKFTMKTVKRHSMPTIEIIEAYDTRDAEPDEDDVFLQNKNYLKLFSKPKNEHAMEFQEIKKFAPKENENETVKMRKTANNDFAQNQKENDRSFSNSSTNSVTTNPSPATQNQSEYSQPNEGIENQRNYGDIQQYNYFSTNFDSIWRWMLDCSGPSRFKTDFVDISRIGQGGFGSVFKARHRLDSQYYAVKKINFSFKNLSQLDIAYKRVVREVRCLSSLNHPSIIRYFGTWLEPVEENEDGNALEDGQNTFEENFDVSQQGKSLEKIADFEQNPSTNGQSFISNTNIQVFEEVDTVTLENNTKKTDNGKKKVKTKKNEPKMNEKPVKSVNNKKKKKGKKNDDFDFDEVNFPTHFPEDGDEEHQNSDEEDEEEDEDGGVNHQKKGIEISHNENYNKNTNKGLKHRNSSENSEKNSSAGAVVGSFVPYVGSLTPNSGVKIQEIIERTNSNSTEKSSSTISETPGSQNSFSLHKTPHLNNPINSMNSKTTPNIKSPPSSLTNNSMKKASCKKKIFSEDEGSSCSSSSSEEEDEENEKKWFKKPETSESSSDSENEENENQNLKKEKFSKDKGCKTISNKGSDKCFASASLPQCPSPNAAINRKAQKTKNQNQNKKNWFKHMEDEDEEDQSSQSGSEDKDSDSKLSKKDTKKAFHGVKKIEQAQENDADFVKIEDDEDFLKHQNSFKVFKNVGSFSPMATGSRTSTTFNDSSFSRTSPFFPSPTTGTPQKKKSPLGNIKMMGVENSVANSPNFHSTSPFFPSPTNGTPQNFSSKKKYTMSLYIQTELCSSLTLEDWLKSYERTGNSVSPAVSPKNFSQNTMDSSPLSSLSSLSTNSTQNQKKIVDLLKTFQYFIQIVEALNHIHSRQLIHRDVKPSNIFISRDGVNLKLGDFGLSIFENEFPTGDTSNFYNENSNNPKQSHIIVNHPAETPSTGSPIKPSDQKIQIARRNAVNGCIRFETPGSDESESSPTPLPPAPPATGKELQVFNNMRNPAGSALKNASPFTPHTKGIGTFLYASPEQLYSHEYCSKSDIYSLGIILFEMLNPFATRFERAKVLENLKSSCGSMINPTLLKQFPEEMELVRACLHRDVAKRPTAREILKKIENSKQFIVENPKRFLYFFLHSSNNSFDYNYADPSASPAFSQAISNLYSQNCSNLTNSELLLESEKFSKMNLNLFNSFMHETENEKEKLLEEREKSLLAKENELREKELYLKKIEESLHEKEILLQSSSKSIS